MNIETIKKIDKYLGTPLVLKLGTFTRLFGRKPKNIDKILVIMFWGIGSNITSIPVLKALKLKYPKAKIDVLAPKKNKDIFFNNKHIDELVLVDLSFLGLIKTIFKIKNNYDFVVDTEHWLNISAILSYFAGKKRVGFSNRLRSLIYTDKIRFNSKKHAVLNNLDLIGFKGNITELDKIETSVENKEKVNFFLNDKEIYETDILIGVCPGSGGTVKARRWPKERFGVLCDFLVEQYKAKIIFIGSEDEKPLIESIQGEMKNYSYNNCGMSLSDSIELISRCNVFISNDTGPMHIATTQGVKTIGLFGPETPVIFGPYGKNNISLFKAECGPCIKIYRGEHIKCDDNKCMKLITIDDVKDAVKKIMKK